MDKNIKEMSKQFADEMYSEIMTDDRWLKARYFYERGANAVLEEIEAVLNKGNKICCDDFFIIAEIERKIKQLKEE